VHRPDVDLVDPSDPRDPDPLPRWLQFRTRLHPVVDFPNPRPPILHPVSPEPEPEPSLLEPRIACPEPRIVQCATSNSNMEPLPCRPECRIVPAMSNFNTKPIPGC
jgi:hypothetical protein